ncbi:hypothetical protein CC86DRAFT_345372 [Ophiobolus disseminans]|uniref:F-box domain-containing protein n=1 Tax=Ophiobolus disseminans TaxID=1469910 RepID=A0A6A7A6Z7_9PLEO|nr:hypothetical protein CC86DRAFT_345372 [Ophiobolus disseminans]
MFSNLQIRPARPHPRRKPSMAARAGVSKRRVSQINTNINDVPSMDFMEGLFGDEFPEAFAGGSNVHAAKGTKSILDLPAELLAIIAEDLSKMDLKRLRLASTYLATNVDLRINRILISPNRANSDCLQNVLNHPRYRFQVHEIIWDDAQLEEFPDLNSFHDAILLDESNTKQEIEQLLEVASRDYESQGPETRIFDHDDFFDRDGRLTEVAKSILLRRDDQVSRDIIARNATVMSIEESYGIYQRLYQEEQEIMKEKVDVAALQHALAVCPNLERIVLTSEVWRPWNFQPAYVTPFYRSLPPGFRKPSVWPWLSHRPQFTLAQAARRNEVMRTTISGQSKSLSHEFRGYSTVVSALISMDKPSRISEFIVYSGNETLGISHQLFATFNADWHNTITMAHLIPLKRLKLSMNSYGADHSTTASYLRSGQMHALFRSMPHLEHLDLSPNCLARREDNRSIEASVFYPSDIFPPELLPRLKTFALRNVYIVYENLLDLICAMTSAQHISLDNFRMESLTGTRASYYKLFQRMWIHYDLMPPDKPCSRPHFTVIEPVGEGTRSRLVSEDLNHYLYNEQYNRNVPFVDNLGEGQIRGGWVVDDRDERFCERVEWREGW